MALKLILNRERFAVEIHEGAPYCSPGWDFLNSFLEIHNFEDEIQLSPVIIENGLEIKPNLGSQESKE